jgi:hypothetical protein
MTTSHSIELASLGDTLQVLILNPFRLAETFIQAFFRQFYLHVPVELSLKGSANAWIAFQFHYLHVFIATEHIWVHDLNVVVVEIYSLEIHVGLEQIIFDDSQIVVGSREVLEVQQVLECLRVEIRNRVFIQVDALDADQAGEGEWIDIADVVVVEIKSPQVGKLFEPNWLHVFDSVVFQAEKIELRVILESVVIDCSDTITFHVQRMKFIETLEFLSDVANRTLFDLNSEKIRQHRIQIHGNVIGLKVVNHFETSGCQVLGFTIFDNGSRVAEVFISNLACFEG